MRRLVLACLILLSGCGYRDEAHPGPKSAAAEAEFFRYRTEQTIELAKTEESAEAAARVVYTRCLPARTTWVAAMHDEGYNPWFVRGVEEGRPDDERAQIMSDILELRAAWMKQGAAGAPPAK